MELSRDRKPGCGGLASVCPGGPKPPFEWENYSRPVSLIQGGVLRRVRDGLSRANCSPKVSEGSRLGPRTLMGEKKASGYLPEGTRPTPLSAMTPFLYGTFLLWRTSVQPPGREFSPTSVSFATSRVRSAPFCSSNWSLTSHQGKRSRARPVILQRRGRLPGSRVCWLPPLLSRSGPLSSQEFV